MNLFAMAFAVSALIAGAAHAAESPPRPPKGLSSPDWVRKPTQEELIRILPTEATRHGKDGRAVIQCLVNVSGSLYACQIVEESPPDLGFGTAALALVPMFQMRPMTIDGSPVAGGTVRIPINWRLSGNNLPPGRPLYTDVPWRKTPTFEQLMAAYPRRGREYGKDGQVMLFCGYTPAGQLRHCETASERPRGYGFAEAAKTLAPLFEGPPLGDELKGKSVQAQVAVSFPAASLDGARTVGQPQWLALPSAGQFLASYPTAAQKAGLNGRAVLSCVVADAGLVKDCAVAAEDPPGQGFGEAALKLAPGFRMTTWTQDGLPTPGGSVRIPVRFELADPPAPAEKRQPSDGAVSVQAVRFTPLLKSERRFASLGPAGPFYPEVAVRARRNGEAILECRAGAAGALDQCKIINETPPHFDFGAAARVMADRRRIRASEPASLSQTVRVRVPFVIGAPADVQP